MSIHLNPEAILMMSRTNPVSDKLYPHIELDVRDCSESFDFIKQAFFHLGLTLIKFIAVPIVFALAAVAATALVITTLATLCIPNKLRSCLTGITLDLLSKIPVIITYGIHGNNPIVPANEQDQNGPQYLCLIPKQGDSNQTPILFAPGYMESPEGLQGTCQRLADATGRRVYVVKYTSRFQSIDEHANDIATVAQQIFKEMNQLNQRDTSSLILGGHSMGGLSTGRYLTQAAGLGVTIEHWFTIATPLNGAPIARIGAGACAKDMIPGSVFLRALHTDLEAISVPSIHFYSHADLIVPPDYAQFNGKQMQVSGIDFGHMSIKESPQIMGQIAATIGDHQNSNHRIKI